MIRDIDKWIFYSGNSMWPTFRPGDRLILTECDATSLRKGEVVVYRGEAHGKAECRAPSADGDRADAERFVCHRVLSVSESNGNVRVRTQGDCSPRADREWPGDRLVGRVVEVSPVKGRSRRLKASPFLGWRLRKGICMRRIARAIWRRLRGHRTFLPRRSIAERRAGLERPPPG